MKTTYYYFHFSNGQRKFLTPTDAENYRIDQNCQITYNGFLDFVEKATTRRPIRAFREGYHPGLGMYVKSESEYKDILKERGLVEVGNDRVDNTPTKVENAFYSDDNLKQIVGMGADLSGNEIAALKSGEKLYKE